MAKRLTTGGSIRINYSRTRLCTLADPFFICCLFRGSSCSFSRLQFVFLLFFSGTEEVKGIRDTRLTRFSHLRTYSHRRSTTNGGKVTMEGGGMSRDEGLKERTNDGTWFCFRFFENKTTQGRLGRDMRRSTIAAKSNWGKHLFCFNNWCSCRGETKEQIYFDVILKRKRQRGEGEKKVPALEATTTKLLSFCFLVTRELYHYMLASQNSQSPLFFAKVILTKTQPPT